MDGQQPPRLRASLPVCEEHLALLSVPPSCGVQAHVTDVALLLAVCLGLAHLFFFFSWKRKEGGHLARPHLVSREPGSC